MTAVTRFRSKASDPAMVTAPPDAVALERRSFLRGRFKKAPVPALIRPPWTTESRIASDCTGCGDCSRACPQGLISLARDGTPVVDFSQNECSFCGDCAAACPEPVFAETDTKAWQLTLHVSSACLAAAGTYCRSCGDVCAEAAITFKPKLGGAADIWFEPSECSGCGACVTACPVGAASLSPSASSQEAGHD